MGEIINVNNTHGLVDVDSENGLIELTEQLLLDARNTINSNNALSVPIAELSTLGAGVASLIPALNTVTQTTTISAKGLYQLANADVGDALKVARNGNFWGAFKTAEGKSKFAQLKAADPLSATTTTAAAINPATMLMAVALFSIEKELGNIAEMERQVLSFLEVEKEAEIEADVETLMGIVTNYKLNWNNEHFVASNHKLVLDIQRTARKNMNAYQKKVKEVLKAKQFIVAQGKITSTLSILEKKFQYYRLSLYTFSLASLIEVMLGGDFKEEYIAVIRDEIIAKSETYRELFCECSMRLEKMGSVGLEANVVKGIGTSGRAVGKLIGNIPLVKEGPVDEFLQDKGAHLQQSAIEMEKKAVKTFAAIGNPGTGMFVDKLEDMIRIYNRTSKIYFDNENIYLLAN